MADSNTTLTRNELLIVLDYLHKYTDGSHHATQASILQYAAKKYGITMRRDRVGDILKYLYETSHQYLGDFPFTLEEKTLNQQSRYYLSKRLLSEFQLQSICQSIINDKYTSNEMSHLLIDRLVKGNTSEYQAPLIKEKLVQRRLNISKIDKDTNLTIKRLEKAIIDKSLVELTIKDQWSLTYDRSVRVNRVDENNTIRVYIFAIKEYLGRLYAIAGDGANDALVRIPIDECRVVKAIPMEEDAPSIHALLQHFEYATLDEYLNEAVIPSGGRILNIIFTFSDGQDMSTLERVKNSFLAHFKIPLPYERVVEKYYMRSLIEGTNPPQFEGNANKEIELIFVKAEIKMDSESFLKWIIDPYLLSILKIKEPLSLRQDLQRRLARWMNRFKSML
jgi:hypothetical protein